MDKRFHDGIREGVSLLQKTIDNFTSNSVLQKFSELAYDSADFNTNYQSHHDSISADSDPLKTFKDLLSLKLSMSNEIQGLKSLLASSLESNGDDYSRFAKSLDDLRSSENIDLNSDHRFIKTTREVREIINPNALPTEEDENLGADIVTGASHLTFTCPLTQSRLKHPMTRYC